MAHPAPTKPVIVGCAGPSLSDAERALFAVHRPAGLILFKRNCQSPDQVRALVADFREAVGRHRLPVLIDQEGGRVVRLAAPHWREPPAARLFGELAERDWAAGAEALTLNCRLIADDLAGLGITVDCLPLLDLPADDADAIIGDRAYGTDPDFVARLGRVAMDALIAGGCLPVIKHVPGHGRARVDSHLELPRVEAPAAALEAHDFAPFKALADAPLAMTAHIVYQAFDADRCATLSPTVIGEVVRGRIGFEGLLMSDDLSMAALSGSMADRARGCLDAGCDLALHCNGDLAEMTEVLEAVAPASDRLVHAIDACLDRIATPQPLDRAAALQRLDALLAPA